MVSGCFEDLFNIGIDNVTGTKVAGIEPAERINAANDIFLWPMLSFLRRL